MNDNKLKALLVSDEAPARDPVFELQVLAGIERQRYWRGIADLLPMGLVVGFVAWSIAPVLDLAALNDATLLAATIAGGVLFMIETWQSQR